jgi:hypothetical protein
MAHVVDRIEWMRSKTRTQGKRYGRRFMAGSRHVELQPSHGPAMSLPFAFGKSRASYSRAQALGAVEHCWTGDDLPLEVLVGEPIADLDLHRQD